MNGRAQLIKKRVSLCVAAVGGILGPASTYPAMRGRRNTMGFHGIPWYSIGIPWNPTRIPTGKGYP